MWTETLPHSDLLTGVFKFFYQKGNFKLTELFYYLKLCPTRIRVYAYA